MRTGILLFMLHLAVICKAQQDSVVLKEVIVYCLAEAKYLAGSKITVLDSSLTNIYQGNHLGDFLSCQFPVYFRNYGNGMLSGISMRGTSPSHTAVLWNGININSFSLAQADFSILPSAAFDRVSVLEGGGSTRFGSGAIGGAVLLQSGADNGPIVLLRQEAGSFGRYFTSAKANVSLTKLSLSTSVYRQQAENDFPIHKTGERQEHAAFLQQGFVQLVQYNFTDAKSLQAAYWFHDADRELQPPAGSVNVYNEQQDRNHRLSVSYQQNTKAGLLKAGGGTINDKIVYNGNASKIFRYVAFVNYQYTFARRWSVQTGADWNHIIGRIKEYDGEPEEDRLDLFISTQKEFSSLKLSVNLRKPFVTGIQTPVLPYVGAEIQLVNNHKHSLYLLANASKNFRVPTLNDRYWEDAGNQNLLPEESYAGETGISWKYHALSVNLTGFYQRVDQWIQWKPGTGGAYRPDNILKVAGSGIESTAGLNFKTTLLTLSINGTYQYTRSIIEETREAEKETIGKQLSYTPLHTAAISAMGNYKNWSVAIFNQFSGKRYTDDLNTALYSLDPYVITDLSVGKVLHHRMQTFTFQFLIRNLLNIEYQQYAGRAMPGRSFTLSLSYQLNPTSNKPSIP